MSVLLQLIPRGIRAANIIYPVVPSTFSGSFSTCSSKLGSSNCRAHQRNRFPGLMSGFRCTASIVYSEISAPNLINYQPRRNAGHSKWQNIKHIKEAKDQARSKEMSKMLLVMKSAVRDNGSDPSKNTKLAQLIQQCKDRKIPMASIEKFLKGAQRDKKSLQRCIHPIRGPGNCAMLVDIESASLVKARQDLNTVLRKNKGIVGDSSLVKMFEHKGILHCSEVGGNQVTEEHLDEATGHAIESGADDVIFISDHPEFGAVLEFSTEPTSFYQVKGALEKLNYNLIRAELEYIPHNPLELDDADLEAANNLYEKLTEHPDVQNVFANIA